MTDELDLSRYVALITRYWKWILGLTVGAMVAAAMVSTFLVQPTYEAEANVVVIERSYRLTFDSRVKSEQDRSVSTKTYARLAKNSELMKQIIELLGNALPAELRSAEALADRCAVSSDTETDAMRFRVAHTDPQAAADVANTWAALFVQQANRIYGESADDVERIERQVQAAAQRLHEAEQEVLAFYGSRPLTVLGETIKAQSAVLAEYVAAETKVELALRDAQSLREQWQAVGAESPALTDQLSALLGELGALYTQSDEPSLLLGELGTLHVQSYLGPRIQGLLQTLAAGELATSERIRQLDDLIGALGAKRQALAAYRDGIAEKILAAQAELRSAQVELDQLSRAVARAEESYTALSRKAEELRVGSQLDPGGVRVASRAVVPSRPSSPRTLLNIAVAGVLALMAAVITMLAREYAPKPRKVAEER